MCGLQVLCRLVCRREQRALYRAFLTLTRHHLMHERQGYVNTIGFTRIEALRLQAAAVENRQVDLKGAWIRDNHILLLR